MIIREEFPNLMGVEDPRVIINIKSNTLHLIIFYYFFSKLTNPYGFKPPYKFGTISSGSTEEVIKKTHPSMYDYMRPFMSKNVTQGIQKVKNQ